MKKCVFLVAQSVHKNVRPSVVVVVGEVGAHTGKYLAVLIVAQPLRQGHLGESSIAIVAEELLGERVVGDEYVRPSVPVEVVHGDSQALPRRRRDAALLRNLGKRTITVVVIDEVGGWPELIRRAVRAVTVT